MHSWLRTSAIAAAISLSVVGSARADDDPKIEARERFGHGLRLFNDGDNAGALAEFSRAYQLSPHPFVLYNIGLVHAAMGHAPEAVRVLEQVLQNPGNLGDEKIARARETRDAQAARVAELIVTANVEGARIDVDGVAAGKTPLSSPLRVTSGERVVSVVASGYAPERREVVVAGKTATKLAFELVPFDGRFAHLALETRVPGMAVAVDGKRVGTTPLAATLTLLPGTHSVTLSRPGYVSATQSVTLGEGASGKVAFDPVVDTDTLGRDSGRLALDLGEADAVIEIDGKSLGKYSGPLRLPPGPHRLAVQRDGFEPLARDVQVASGKTVTSRVELEPTPGYRAEYEHKASLFRIWGIAGIAGGAVLAGAGAGFLIWNHGKENDYLSQGQVWQDRIDHKQCNSSTLSPTDCNQGKSAAIESYDRAHGRAPFGWAAIGLGGAAIATGVVLLVTGDDPHRYEHEQPELGRVKIRPSFAAGGASTLFGFSGTF